MLLKELVKTLLSVGLICWFSAFQIPIFHWFKPTGPGILLELFFISNSEFYSQYFWVALVKGFVSVSVPTNFGETRLSDEP